MSGVLGYDIFTYMMVVWYVYLHLNLPVLVA